MYFASHRMSFHLFYLLFYDKCIRERPGRNGNDTCGIVFAVRSSLYFARQAEVATNQYARQCKNGMAMMSDDGNMMNVINTCTLQIYVIYDVMYFQLEILSPGLFAKSTVNSWVPKKFINPRETSQATECPKYFWLRLSIRSIPPLTGLLHFINTIMSRNVSLTEFRDVCEMHVHSEHYIIPNLKDIHKYLDRRIEYKHAV